MLGDRCPDRAQLGGRIESVQPGCSDERVDRSGAPGAGVGSHEEIIPAAYRDEAFIVSLSSTLRQLTIWVPIFI